MDWASLLHMVCLMYFPMTALICQRGSVGGEQLTSIPENADNLAVTGILMQIYVECCTDSTLFFWDRVFMSLKWSWNI